MSGRTNSSRFVAVLAMVGAGLVASSMWPSERRLAADPTAKREASKIAIVRITDVLKDTDSIFARGNNLTVRRAQGLSRITELRTEMFELNRKFAETTEAPERVSLQKRAAKLQRQLEDIERDVQTKMTERSDELIVSIHKEIRETVAEMAVERDLDLVLLYPHSKDNTAAIAQIVLQAPAAMPIWNRPDIDLTDALIARLNQKYPAEKRAPAKAK